MRLKSRFLHTRAFARSLLVHFVAISTPPTPNIYAFRLYFVTTRCFYIQHSYYSTVNFVVIDGSFAFIFRLHGRVPFNNKYQQRRFEIACVRLNSFEITLKTV